MQKLGHVADAVEGYRRALALDPVNADANANLGHLLKDQGEGTEAMRCYEAAIRFQPQVRSVHKHLASLYLDAGRSDEATRLFRTYLDRFPDDAEANSNYAYALEKLDRWEEALPFYLKAHEQAPDSAEICSNLGGILRRLDRHDEADLYHRRAVALASDNPVILRNRAVALMQADRPGEALELWRRLVALEPDSAAHHSDLGACLGTLGHANEALAALLRADALAPKNAEYLANIGSALGALSRHGEAVEAFRAALAAAGEGTALLHANLCMSLQKAGFGDEANVQAHVAMQMPGWEPRMAPAVNTSFRATCDFEGTESLGDLITLCEEHVKPKSLIGAFLDLRPLTDDIKVDRRLTALHVKWGDDAMARAANSPLAERTGPRRGGKIRLGFLSSDLRSHAVAKFVKPLFDHYDRDRFEILAYTQFDLPSDPMQVELKAKVAHFRLTWQMSDREVAATIRADDVDVLFELNAATQHSQLGALAWRPAPMQVSWLGYGGTTGLRAVDYALMDRYVKPTEPDLWVEKFLEMQGAWVCFSDYPDTPIHETLPLERNGVVTFGTMNACYKQTPAMIALWARILHAVPGSRMLFVRPEFKALVARANIAREFVKHGIAPERILFIANVGGQFNHLQHYNEIDISLDTYPAVGGTTSCDTMWMGVPIVGRYGPNMHQRLNYALSSHCGLGELSVTSDDAYFETAVRLATDTDRLHALRRGLRDVVKASPLYDAAGFARDFQDRVMELVERHGLR